MVVVAEEGVQEHHFISSSLRGKSTYSWYTSLVVSRDFLFEDFRACTKLMKNVSLSLFVIQSNELLNGNCSPAETLALARARKS